MGTGYSAMPKYPMSEDERVERLLAKFGCLVPFHKARTCCMGCIASPKAPASPIKLIELLWSGAMPTFRSETDALDLIGGLTDGLWNKLTVHQKRNNPFRLSVEITGAGPVHLQLFAAQRQDEVDGFIDGLFNSDEDIILPTKAHESLGILGELRSLFAATQDVARRTTGPVDMAALQETLKHLRELTSIAEREINSVILDCAGARQRRFN